MENTYTGTEFLNSQYKKCTVEQFSQKFGKYLIRREDQHITDGSRELMSDQDIEFYLAKQDKLHRLLQKRQERELAEQLEKERQEREYNNTYGFADNLPALQKGKILKTLNTKYNYSNYGKLTRKEFIVKTLQDGYTPKYEENVRYYDKRSGTYKTKNEHRLYDYDKSFYTITKTEYEFALYVQQNIIN